MFKKVSDEKKQLNATKNLLKSTHYLIRNRLKP